MVNQKNTVDWESIRANYPLLTSYTYLNVASSGAISKATKNAVSDFFQDQLLNAAINRKNWVQTIESARLRSAELLNTQQENIGFTTDVSAAMNQLAERVPHSWEVVLIKGDFPSVNLPWINRGFQIKWVEQEPDHSISIEKIKKALEDGGKVLAISWVQYSSGFTIDLAALSTLCQAYETILMVDGTQGVATLPLDLQKVKLDALMASSFKWQAAGYGTSIYFESEDLQEKLLQNQTAGWNTLQKFNGPLASDNFKKGAKRVESGHSKYVAIHALNQSLGELAEIGFGSIFKRNQELRQLLAQTITDANLPYYSPEGFEHQAPIICVKSSQEMYQYLAEQNIMVTRRDDYIRISVHFYNNENDLFRLREVLASFSASK